MKNRIMVVLFLALFLKSTIQTKTKSFYSMEKIDHNFDIIMSEPYNILESDIFDIFKIKGNQTRCSDIRDFHNCTLYGCYFSPVKKCEMNVFKSRKIKNDDFYFKRKKCPI